MAERSWPFPAEKERFREITHLIVQARRSTNRAETVSAMSIRRDGPRFSTDTVLETPREAGFRAGMPAVGLIGTKLARVYDVAPGVPRQMGILLQTLDAAGSRRRD